LEVPETISREERIIAAVERVVKPVLAAHGVVLFEAALRRERNGVVLRVMIEREQGEPGEGITVDLCADISRDLSAALDVADPISFAYVLEVSSPGIERPSRSSSDYERFAGRPAKLVLREALADGQKALRGTLRGVVEGRVVIEADGREHAIEPANIKAGNLTYEIPSQPKRKNEPKQGKRPRSGR